MQFQSSPVVYPDDTTKTALEQYLQHSLKAVELWKRTAELAERIAAEEIKIRDAVARETNDQGKPIFSNETLRDAEFLRRAESNEELKQMKAELRELQVSHKTAEVYARYYLEAARFMRRKDDDD